MKNLLHLAFSFNTRVFTPPAAIFDTEVLCDKRFAAMAQERIKNDAPMFTEVSCDET